MFFDWEVADVNVYILTSYKERPQFFLIHALCRVVNRSFTVVCTVLNILPYILSHKVVEGGSKQTLVLW